MDQVSDAESTVVAPVATVSPPVSTSIATVKPQESTKTLRDLDGMKFAQLCVSSGLFKDTADVAKAAMKIKFGYALGIDEATAMSNIILVSGRMSFTANFIAGRIKQSNKYRYVVLEKTDKQCKIQFYEKVEQWKDGRLIFEWEKPGPAELFTLEMAKRAGLTKNETWTKYPEAMCFARCLTAGARTYCSDVFLGTGVYTPDELDPNLNVSLNDNGDMVVEDNSTKSVPTNSAKKITAKSVVAANKAKLDTPEEVIKRILALVAEMGVDTKPYSALYGVSDMMKLNLEQLHDFERRLEQKKASS
jgi:hypothetical protein